jgi:AcrR family transcriptional regulator
MEAALEVFGHFGFKKASIEDIARQAGVGKGSVYLHFESKEALFEAVMRQDIERFFIMLEGLFAAEASPEGKLRIYLSQMLQQKLRLLAKIGFGTHSGLEAAETAMELTGVGMKVAWEYRERALKTLTGILCEGRDTGVFYIENVQATSEVIHRVVLTPAAKLFADTDEGQQAIHTLSELIIRGLKAAPPPKSS